METISTPSSVLASGGNGYACELLQAISDARLQSCETEGEIKDAIQRLQLENTVNFRAAESNMCSVERTLTFRLTEIEKENLRTEGRISNRINDFERSVDEKICTLRTEAKDNTRVILDRLSADKLDEKNELIDELRHSNRHKDQTLLFSNQLNELKSMVNSVEQNQRISSKIVQFGANVATPTQTSNQG